MTDTFIPFNKPAFVPEETEYIQQALESGHISGDGAFTKKCSACFEQGLGVPKALLTTSCTHALEMAALLLDIQPGDEVIVPSFTFVSTVNAFVLRGAKPVFVDIRPDTLNLDEATLEAVDHRHAPRPSCRCIMPGWAARWTPSWRLRIATALPWSRITRTACSASTGAGDLGTFGALATQSFHETKNISCGEGGALLINDPRYIERAEIIREKGTNRSRFFRGQVDKYTWVDIGSSYLPSDILAAFLLGAARGSASRSRRSASSIWERYDSDLAGWAEENGVRLPIVPAHCEQSYHMFYLLLPSLEWRTRFIAHLKEQGILASSTTCRCTCRTWGGSLAAKPATAR